MTLTVEEVQAALPRWCVWKEWARWVASHPAGLKIDAADGETLVQECQALEGEDVPLTAATLEEDTVTSANPPTTSPPKEPTP